MAKHNILSFDGGGILALLPVLLAERLAAERPGFLDQVDLYAGTSAGGVNALILAATADPVAGLAKCRQLWESVPIFKVDLPGVMRAMVGKGAMHTDTVFKAALIDLFGTQTLGQLPKRVVIPAFQLDNRDTLPARRRWQPRIFTNFDPEHPDDRLESVVDIALRTSAAPLIFPVHQGFIDGGLFANDPSMFALTAEAAYLHTTAGRQRHVRDRLDDISVFSFGCGQNRHFLEAGDESWGYRDWVFGPKVPLALLEIALHAEGEAIGSQCRQLLGDHQYFRLNPDTAQAIHRATNTVNVLSGQPKPLPTSSRGRLDNPSLTTIQHLKSLAADLDLDEPLAWLAQSSWFKKSAPVTAAPADLPVAPGAD